MGAGPITKGAAGAAGRTGTTCVLTGETCLFNYCASASEHTHVVIGDVGNGLFPETQFFVELFGFHYYLRFIVMFQLLYHYIFSLLFCQPLFEVLLYIFVTIQSMENID